MEQVQIMSTNHVCKDITNSIINTDTVTGVPPMNDYPSSQRLLSGSIENYCHSSESPNLLDGAVRVSCVIPVFVGGVIDGRQSLPHRVHRRPEAREKGDHCIYVMESEHNRNSCNRVAQLLIVHAAGHSKKINGRIRHFY